MLSAFAQVELTQGYGSIAGTVLDSTGAAVSGATVTVTRLDSGRQATVVTNGSGTYAFPSLAPAHYQVTVAARGFQGFQQADVFLHADESLNVGAKLKVGSVSDIVQVNTVVRNSYSAGDSTAATHTDTPLIDLPQSVQVLSQALIEEQDRRTLNDALVNVSGVTPTKPEEALFAEPIVRGFPAEVYLDGLPEYGATQTANDPTSLVGAERIEVVKGPTSTVYGGGAGAPLGGLINVVSKRPESTAGGSVAFRGGSFSTLDPSADLRVPLGSAVATRATGEYQHNQSWIDRVQGERWSAQPTVLFHLNPATELSIQGRYDRRDQVEYSGLPAAPALAGQLDRNAFPGATAGQPRNTIQNSTETVEVRHRLTENIRFSLTGRYYNSGIREYGSFAFPSFLPPDPATPTTYSIFTIFLPTKVKESMVDANLFANVRGLGGRHELLGGFNYDHTNFEGDLGFNGVPVGVLDLARPNYTLTFGTTPALNTFQTNRYETAAGYVQDQATYGRLHVLDSLRLTHFGLRQRQQSVDTSYVRLNPRVGATVDVTRGIALYGAFATGFRGAVNFIGLTPPKPETSHNAEGGLKLALSSVGLSGTVAAFQQTRRNVATVDPNHPLYSIQAGEERARGVEADALWEPTSSFSLLADYAYTGAEVTQDTVIPVGDRLPRVPRHSGRVAAHYRVQHGPAKGLSFGAGVTAFTRRHVYLPNTVSTPGYAAVDVQAAYSFGRFTLESSAVNLANHRAFDPYSYLSPVVIPNQPRSAYLTLKASL